MEKYLNKLLKMGLIEPGQDPTNSTPIALGVAEMLGLIVGIHKEAVIRVRWEGSNEFVDLRSAQDVWKVIVEHLEELEKPEPEPEKPKTRRKRAAKPKPEAEEEQAGADSEEGEADDNE